MLSIANLFNKEGRVLIWLEGMVILNGVESGILMPMRLSCNNLLASIITENITLLKRYSPFSCKLSKICFSL